LDRNLFISGGAGTGKSYTLRSIAESYEKQKKIVIRLASTAIAGLNIDGDTLHRFFGFGICKDFLELSHHDRKHARSLKEKIKIISKSDLILIDEISMVSANLIDMIAKRLYDAGFNGKVVFAGDFYQLPPVLPRYESPNKNLFSEAKKYAFESDAWKDVFDPKYIELKESHRTKDLEFIKMLNNLRVGKFNASCEKLLRKYAAQEDVLLGDPTHLYPRNAEVDFYNEKRLAKIKSEERIYEAAIITADYITDDQLEQFIKTLTTPRELKLKIGAKIIFTKNDPYHRFFNGEKGEIVELNEDQIAVKKDNGEEVLAERCEFKQEKFTKIAEDNNGIETETMINFIQFPMRLAWAITIHKSQGMGIDNLVINLDNRLFENGQFYVAISRASNPEKLFLQTSNDVIFAVKGAIQPKPAVDKFYESVLI
jgi:ATP-dependent exoDNAse (exonuclease V) alpha subunit